MEKQEEINRLISYHIYRSREINNQMLYLFGADNCDYCVSKNNFKMCKICKKLKDNGCLKNGQT